MLDAGPRRDDEPAEMHGLAHGRIEAADARRRLVEALQDGDGLGLRCRNREDQQRQERWEQSVPHPRFPP